MRLLVIVAVLGCAFGLPKQFNGKIVGGEEANIADVPYQLALESDPPFCKRFFYTFPIFLKNYLGIQICGATIISSRTALTAGHCVVG